MIINKLDRLNIQRQSGSGNYRIIATIRDTVDSMDNQFNELNSQNSNLIISNRYNVVTERDCTSIFFSGNIGDVFTITYQQWVVLLGEESYYDILIDTITLQETTKLYYFRDDLVVDSYSIGEVDALLALKANTEHTHTIADIEDLDTTLSIIESDILLKADIDHGHDADYHPLNGNIDLGVNGNWNIHDANGVVLLADNDNNEIVSLWPIRDASVYPEQGIIHTNRPNLDSINQDLGTTNNVAFGRIQSIIDGKARLDIKATPTTTMTQDTLDIIGNSVDTPLSVVLRSTNGGNAILYLDGSGTEESYCWFVADANDVLSIFGKGGIIFGQQVKLANLTTTQRNALTPANGMMIYNATDNKVQAYANGAWVNLH